MGKRILSVLAGLATAVVAIFLMEMVSQYIYPVPKGIDLRNKESVTEMIKNMPTGAFMLVLLGYALGSFLGGLVAATFAAEKKMRSALIVGIFLTLSGLVNLVMIPHPGWFMVANLLVYVPLALLGGFLVRKAKNK